MAKAILIVEDGVDDFELYYAKYRLLEEGYEVLIASHEKYSNTLEYDPKTGSTRRAKRKIKSKYNLEYEADITYKEALNTSFDILVIPGGRSPERARLYADALELVRKAEREGKTIIAICHGPLLLASAGIIRGRRVTGHPGIGDDLRAHGAEYTGSPAERDGNIITVRHTTTIHEGFRLALPK